MDTERQKEFKVFLGECADNFKSIAGKSAVVISKKESIVENGNVFILIYNYELREIDEQVLGPYSFQCRKPRGEKMQIYLEL